jgi:putative nucleotidyltransferase with HDIG domain
MFLEQNLAILNSIYGQQFEFYIDGDVVKVKEQVKMAFTNSPVKNLLRQKYPNVYFDRSHSTWIIDKHGTELLDRKLIRVQPFRPVEVLKQNLCNLIKMIQETDLSDSLAHFFLFSHPDFFILPASHEGHHGYKGGLVEHTIQVAELALKITEVCEETNDIDKDLIIAGALLHDVGKINCYEFQPDNSIGFTETYSLQNHVFNGGVLCAQEIQSEHLNQILHIIASHHQRQDWGSPVEPRNIEAWIIHYADDLSARTMG